MKFARTYLILFMLPGLMFCIFPVVGEGTPYRLSWQVVSIWTAGVVVALHYTSLWRSGFLLLAIFQVAAGHLVITSFINLMMIAIFTGSVELFKRIKKEVIANAICIGGLVLCYWISGQKIGLFPAPASGIFIGPFNVDEASVYLAMTVPAFLGEKRLRWGLAAIAGGLWFARSTTGMLAGLAGVLVWMMLSGDRAFWKWMLGGSAVVFAGIFLLLQDPLINAISDVRWRVWSWVIQAIATDPMGYGLGSFAQIFPVITLGDSAIHPPDQHWMQAHNEYLQVGFEMGVQGLVLLVGFVIWFVANAWKRRKTEIAMPASGMTAVIVACFGWHTFHIAPLALLGCAWIALFEMETDDRRPPTADRQESAVVGQRSAVD